MRRIDLNLLYVLRELLREPNTTKVGEKLGLTQSAVSSSLGRLRWAFQDDLFVRSGRAMAPTRRAETLLEPVEDIIRRIEALVSEVHFEPSELKRTFTLATADWLLELLAGPVLAQMHPDAPQTRLICSHFLPDTRERLRSGHLDLMISPLYALASQREMQELSMEAIYADRLVAVVSTGNERYGDSLSEEEFLAADFVSWNPAISGGWSSTSQRFAANLGEKLNVIGEFSMQHSMLRAISTTQLMGIVPNMLVRAMADEIPVRILEIPGEVPEFEVGLGWNNSFDNDPEHQWFRGIVQSAASRIFSQIS